MAVPPGSSDPELLLWQVTGKVRNSTPKQVDNLMIPLNALVTFHHDMGNTLAACSHAEKLAVLYLELAGAE